MATLPTYTAPTYKELGTYSAPTWDESAIDTLTQKRAAPGLRALRQSVNKVTGANYENPNVKRMTLRDALSSYGSGLSTVMGEASETAAGEYGKKYGYQLSSAQAKYTSEANAASAYNTLAQNTAQTQYTGELTGYGTEVGKETAATAAATAAEAAEKQYGYETEAAEKQYGYGKESAKTAAETAAGVATTAYGREQTALENAYELWKKKYLWTAEQEDSDSSGSTSTGQGVLGEGGVGKRTYYGGGTFS